ncbi:MAG: hypothetical protein JWO69_1657 [Thermoleophilia bacterium]|nr:hypothetical protein [Thermoleophilia bacterium]
MRVAEGALTAEPARTSRVDGRVLLVAGWVVALALALFQLLWRLGSAAWQTDEPVYRNAAEAIFAYGNWSHNLEHPLVGKYLIGASRAIFGDSAWATRLPSGIATLAAGLLLAALATRMLRASGRSRAHVAGLVTFAAWTLLPHPDPAFDVARLAYLDAPMAAFIAGAMYAAWRWQEAWSLRWAAATGVLAGLAVGTKLPALFLAAALLVLVAGRSDTSRAKRALQYVVVCSIAAVTALVTWLPLAGDLPRALRFLAAMQGRDIDQSIEVAGRTYADGAPLWTQAWWQWDAWPAFALVQLAAVLLVAWLAPRRAALFALACVLLPALAYAVGGGRILPHWQVTWQPAMAVVLGLCVAGLVASTRAPLLARGTAALMLVVIVAATVQRTADTARRDTTDQMRVAELLRPVDQPDMVVIDSAPAARVERTLLRARPAPWSGTYHSAAESQHQWSRRDGGRPLEPTSGKHRPDIRQVDAIVERTSDEGEWNADGFEPRRAGPFTVWLRSPSDVE